MDWTTIDWEALIKGAGLLLGGGFLKSLHDEYRKRKAKKRKERLEQLATMRSELLEAYALFIGCYSKMNFVAFQMARIRVRIHEQRVEAVRSAEAEGIEDKHAHAIYFGAGDPWAKKRNRTLSEEFNSLYVDTHVQLVRLILLEEDDDRRLFLASLLTDFLEPPRNATGTDLDAHTAELRRYNDSVVIRRWTLDAFVVKLGGRLSAKHWTDATDDDFRVARRSHGKLPSGKPGTHTSAEDEPEDEREPQNEEE